MELSRISAMVELLRDENGYVTQTSAANFAGAGPPFALLERFRGAHYSMYRRGRKTLVRIAGLR